MTICQLCEIEAIHSKLAHQTNAYFCRRIDWRGRNSAETGSTWGGNGLNMGLDRNFFSDGKGNHRISGIQSIPSKTGLIDSSSFVLKKRLARAEIGGEERNMGLARIVSSSCGRASAIQTFKLTMLISKPQFLISKPQF